MSELSADQAEAEERIMDFLDAPRVARQWFALDGLAGTGKSWLLARIARQRRGTMCVYTGKGASVLARKSGLPVTTVHSAIYKYVGKEMNERGDEDLIFMKNVRDARWNGRVIYLDERSMIDESMGRDLLATGARIVATGDPGQLQPIRGRQFFDGADFSLTEIHRQALDSPIIRQAHAVRHGGIYAADGPAFRVQRFVGRDDILAADVILCWRNATRRNLNALKRAHLRYDGPPIPGEPVMCLKNDHDLGVLNGAIYPLMDMGYDDLGLWITVINEYGREATIERAWFEDFDETNRPHDDSVGFAYGYCCTVHKAMGSEWKNVILVDEYSRRDERERFLYTGITRASEQILIQRDW